MQRNPHSDRGAGRRHQPRLPSRHDNACGSIGDSSASSVETLAPAYVQTLPSLEGQPVTYSHEARGELLYELCAALARAGLGTPKLWAECGGNALEFARSSIMNRIGARSRDLLARNIEYYLEISDVAGADEQLEFGKLSVSISCGGCGFLKIGAALATLESEAEGLGASFYWTLIQSLYRVMRIYDYGDAEQYEERLKEYADAEDEGSREQYEFPEVEKALPPCIRKTLAEHCDNWKLRNRQMLLQHRKGPHQDWIERVLNLAKLGRIVSNARDPAESGGYYDEPPLPSLLVIFEEHDAISACFDEEAQYMLEGSSEPALRVVFSPAKQEEVLKAMRAVGHFLLVNLELCRLIEAIQKSERDCEGRRRDRSDASLRAA